jgi:internalin A
LQELYCSYNKITDISALAHVPNLQTLYCCDNKISDLSPIYHHVISGQLQKLSLDGNQTFGIPAGILRGDSDLRNYWQDLAKGKEVQRQLKVQLIGNSRVGKTTLAYALEHKCAPSEPFTSTQGIVIKEIQQALEGEDVPFSLQLWDFHATQRMFLSDDCLYLLLWVEETEEYPGETHHPVSYWLESIHSRTRNSQIIIVKNQIDRSDRLPIRPMELNDNMPGVDQVQREVKISAIQYRGIPTLHEAIKSVLEKFGLELPASWLQVQRQLKQLDQNIISFAHFEQLCTEAGIDHAEWFADYLHVTNVLIYSKGAERIILDQN